MPKPVIAVDLDGTIAKYDDWKGEDVIGDPIEGAVKFVTELRDRGFDVVIFSARAGTELGLNAIWHWLQAHHLEKLVVEVTNVKSYRFSVMVDDRAIYLNPQSEHAALDYDGAIALAEKRCAGALSANRNPRVAAVAS